MPLRTHTAACTGNVCIAHEVYEVRFEKPDGFTFTAGQYVMILTPLIGHPDDVQTRAYSIASSPSEDDLLFVIKLVPDGRMSRFVLEELKPGVSMAMQGPLGVFTLKPDDTRDLLFVCTATGNAPFRSMIREALENGDWRTMDMIFGVRHESDLFWVETFEEMARTHSNFRFHVILSRPGEGWKGHEGHVQDIMSDVAPDLTKRSVYICGNPTMVKEVKRMCVEEWGMEKKQVKVEEYI